MLKKIALSLCFTLFLGLLASCSPTGILHLGKNESKITNIPTNIKRTNSQGTIGTPIAIPPRFGDEPPKPGQTDSQLMPNGLPALSPMKGINIENLFAEKINDTDERFDRVENAVIDIKKELEAYKPAIVRLTAAESDIQNLIKELEVLLQETPPQQPPLDLSGGGGSADTEASRTMQNVMQDIEHSTPQSAPTPPHTYTPVKQQNKLATTTSTTTMPSPLTKQEKRHNNVDKDNSHPTAKNFRIGEHGDILRIAFDTNVKTPFNIELDNDEHLILIELPQASWDGKHEQSFPNSALLETLSIEPTNGGKGSMVIISLKKDTQILQRKHLSPDKSSDYHRVYFDLKL